MKETYSMIVYGQRSFLKYSCPHAVPPAQLVAVHVYNEGAAGYALT